ncbi:hypothetical protein N7475_001934 [Penicillium sp. IBT 31633x]|nr:hypothetical protein N7475_001934 [Penicillium sp. IBT 31633x]
MPKPKPHPLTPPATPIALQQHHLLSPPPDRLTNTATTLSISHTHTPEDPQSHTFSVHRLRPHEAPDSPDRQVLLYTVATKPWPNTARIIHSPDGAPVLQLKRLWLSGMRRWGVRLPENGKGRQSGELLEAVMPWVGEGAKVGIGIGLGVGGSGFRLDLKFVNALRVGEGELRSCGSRSSVSGSVDDPPPYSAVTGPEDEDENESVQCALRNEKSQLPLAGPDLTSSISHASTTPHSMLPSYESVRRDSPNTLRDLLDAIEPPREPAPAPASPLPSHGSSSQPHSRRASLADSDVPAGSRVELKVVKLATTGTGVVMGNQHIMHITRHNSMDYSKSKPKSRPRWEAEIAEGVDLLLAVNIVLIMAESMSQNKWR